MSAWRFAFLGLLPLIPWLQLRIDASFGPFRRQEEMLYVWSGARVQRLVPGFHGLMADIYWLRTVQYFGAQRAFSKEKRFELLRPLIEITTTLDPRLETAYRYGAIFLAEPWPTGKGDPDAGIAILEKGVAANPGSWRLRQDLGYFWYLFKDDAERASKVLLEAAELPGAPFFLRTLGASILMRGGERDTARQIWRQMYEQAEPGAIKDNARWHLEYLDLLDAVDALEAGMERLAQSAGARPASFDDLVRAGLLRSRPTTPDGLPLEYDPETGKVSIPRGSAYWRPR